MFDKNSSKFFSRHLCFRPILVSTNDATPVECTHFNLCQQIKSLLKVADRKSKIKKTVTFAEPQTNEPINEELPDNFEE